MKSRFSIVAMLACAVTFSLLVSCQQDIPSDGSEGSISNGLRVEPDQDKFTPVDHSHDDEVQRHVEELNVDLEDVVPMRVERPDGTVDDVMLVGGCIEMTREQYRDYKDGNLDPRQYSTNNLVSVSGSSRTISVIGYTGGSYALTTRMRTGLSWAVNNLNAVSGVSLNFTLSFTASTSADIVVYRNYTNSGAGGVAGFPYSNGNPYKWVQIYAGMNSYSNNANEHVANHEIMHCLGFRHTDWATRASCNQSGESVGSSGANHIPGTPTGYDSNSIMLACFSSSTNGELGNYDKIALQYLY